MYLPNKERYDKMVYRRCGNSGIRLPLISLGLWHNFGDGDDFDNMVEMLTTAFDLGITHFDLANNYGFPVVGSAEENFGTIINDELYRYRDQMIISTKAGYTMWEGPYGDWGSRKYLLSSLDASLKRMRLDYVDIFYSHRFDPNTPLEETMGALASAVKQGKALYVGISNYGPEETKQAVAILKNMGVPLLIHQPKYSMFVRTPEEGLFKTLKETGVGSIVFSPLAQGLLAGRYLNGIPLDSRVKTSGIFLKEESITEENVEKTKKLNEIAIARGQNLAQMALAWVLREDCVTSALIGASRAEQIIDNVKALANLDFTKEELDAIDKILG
ncbi:L-glyceraldehyde 3-phosphate reductase [Elusimicrobium simillimum]|uniref:L-glyceraldehyde 3-phosphate reductase n=1 Tax=Elusimicrobium simillimum TaxID=3143438 RepID=UPI003C6F9A14